MTIIDIRVRRDSRLRALRRSSRRVTFEFFWPLAGRSPNASTALDEDSGVRIWRGPRIRSTDADRVADADR